MKLFLNIDSTKKGGLKIGEYNEADLGENNEISLTHTFDSLVNPIDYVAEYSYEVKLPRSKKNNILFSHIYKADNYITNSSFDPNKKVPYYIQSDHNDIISRGTCFLNYVDNEFYHFSLLGSLNNIFTRFLNAGWDSNRVEDSDYYNIVDFLAYNGQNYNDKPILNNRVVYGSWEIPPSQRIFDFDELQNKFNQLAGRHINLTNKEVYLANIIGFAIENQGRYPNFQSDKWLKQFGGVLKPINVFRNNESDDPYTLVGDGVNENQMCEYRSYYQQPYIYVNRLLQIFQRESVAITGYKLKFDPSWYNNKDFFTNQLVYMLPSMYSDANPIIIQKEEIKKGVRPTFLPPFSSYDSHTREVAGIENIHLLTDTTNNQSKIFHLEAGKQYNVKMKLDLQYDMSSADIPIISYSKFNYNNPIHIHIYAKKRGDVNDTILTEKKIVLVPTLEGIENISNTIGDALFDQYKTLFNEVYEVKYDLANNDTLSQTNHKWKINKNTIDVTLPIILTETGDIDVFVKVSYLRKYTPFMAHVLNSDDLPTYFHNTIKIEFSSTTVFQLTEQENYRSNQPLTMEKLFESINPFEVVLKFCKLTGKIWVVDDYNKSVTIYDRENYFKTILTTSTDSKTPPVGDIDYKGVFDATNLVDMSKGYNITAPSWKDRFLEFNFNDPDAKYFGEYKEKYGIGYGNKRIITTNEKNNNTYELFCRNQYDTINASMISGEYEIKVDDIKNNNVAVIQNYPQIVNFNDGESSNVWNNFYFRNPNGRFDSGLGNGWRDNYVIITDDYKTETNTNVYCWHSEETHNAVKAYNRPRFNTYTWQDEVSLQFANTREIYHQFPYLPTTKYIYDLYFKNYIEQVYNYQSKKIDLYLVINSQLYRRLKANPFIQIANSVYLVTQIAEWNEKKISTRVTLIQIQDLNQLTNYTLPSVTSTLLKYDSYDTIALDNGDRILINNDIN